MVIHIFFDSPDLNRVLNIFDGHNSPQCRLDTLYAGALCGRIPDPQSQEKVLCTRQDGHLIESRPLCWYPFVN